MVITNMQKAQAYHSAVSEYDVATIEAMVREDYIQHKPHVPTGRSPFLTLLTHLKKHHSKIENIRIF
jgi:predicted SnoaL-like aldol condensation-catalyzing enzyme